MDAVRNGRHAFELLYARIKQDSLHCNAKIISRVHDIAQTLEYVMGKTLSWNYHEIEYICEISSENINYFVWIMTQTDPSRSNWYRVPPPKKQKTNKQNCRYAPGPLPVAMTAGSEAIYATSNRFETILFYYYNSPFCENFPQS